MADYKRMISYMYQYENGVKRRNVGYARIEAKNGQCKITLHMQLLGQLDSVFPTYLIQRGENKIELIYLGDTMLKNQVMDSKLTADEANIMGTGHSLSEMGGLLLFLNDTIFIATEWDDKPVIASEVLDALKPKKAQASPNEGNKKELAASEINNNTVLKVELESIPAAELEQNELSLEEELKIPKYKFPRGWKTVERFQNPLAVEVSIPAAVTLEEVKEAEVQIQKPEEEVQERAIEPVVEDNTVDNYQDETIYQDTNPIEESIYPAEVNKQPEETVQDDGVAPEEPNLEAQSAEEMEQETAKHFFENYPRIYPFEDNEVVLCVKIEPKDIGLLPKDIWALSNNSFLMHGYYCYHHLIFAKMKGSSGNCYVLGIPGIYHNRERFMARMFGFENFKSIRKRDLRQGDFGYWYIPINF